MERVREILGYQVMETLGHGAHSTIFLVRDKKGAIYALKRVIRNGPKDDRFVEQAIHEHQIAKALDHPSLRKSYKLIRSRQLIRVSEVYVLMEFVDGATLEEERPRTVLEVCRIMRPVADALTAMHESGYVHADMKPNNIMVTAERDVKIIDFGQSCKINAVKDRIQGTPDYIAPEQVKRDPIIPQTDIFNLGATMYWLLTSSFVPTMLPRGQAGITPRVDADCKPPVELNGDVPPALSSLVMHCIQKEPDKRPPTMGDVRDRIGYAINQLKRESREGHILLEASAERSVG
jgi:serine/threonine-protein kinase